MKAGGTREIYVWIFFLIEVLYSFFFFNPNSGKQLNHIAEIFVLEVRASWYSLQATHGIISESQRLLKLLKVLYSLFSSKFWTAIEQYS